MYMYSRGVDSSDHFTTVLYSPVKVTLRDSVLPIVLQVKTELTGSCSGESTWELTADVG